MSVFRLPDLGEGLAEAVILAWHVQPGDSIAEGQLLVSVETAKAVVDIPSPRTGRIVALLAACGATVPTHAPLVEFAGTDAAGPETATTVDAGSVVGRLSREPAVSRDTFLVGRHRSRTGTAATGAPERAAAFAGGERLDATRQFMAEAMARADHDVVRVTLTDEADLPPPGTSLTARLVRALAAAAREEPALNAWFDAAAGRRLLHDAVHVGLAVDTPHGLYVPVLRDVAGRPLAEIAADVSRLRQAALERRLEPAQMRGATLTLSNFGPLGGRFATPVVTPPQVAILGAGRAYPRQAGSDATPQRPGLCLPLSLSVDHRVVTGGEAARFLQAVISDLARP